MDPHPQRKTERLRNGRVSIPGARYFITLVTAGREAVFVEGGAAALRFGEALGRLEAEGDACIFAAVIMPDHVHLLWKLGERLPVSKVVAKLKTLSREGGAAWRWQENFFEHRLRADADSEDYARYMFLNPYRAGLLVVTQVWWGWRLGAPRGWRWRFEDALSECGTPPLEWLGEIERVVAGE